MKKLILFFGLLALTLVSCHPDSNTETMSDAKLLFKKQTVDDHEPYMVSYDGFKIIKAETSNYSSTYTYDGDVITKEESADVDYLTSTEYTYENGKIKSSIRKENNGNGTPMTVSLQNDYTYNADGTITIKTTGYTDGNESTVVTFQNGNIVKEDKFNDSGEIISSTVFEYDTKYNPFKNILGFDKLIDAQTSSKNNILKTTQTNGSGQNVSTTVATNVYIYNAQGYPTSVQTTEVSTSSSGDQQTQTDTTKYEY